MITPPKPIASLTSGLLARKGRAQPAMRRQIFGSSDFTSALNGDGDDLGWNDMGEAHADLPVEPSPISADVVIPQTPVAPSPAVAVQEALVAALKSENAGTPVAHTVATPRISARAQGRKAAFTLRLDDERHLRLRLLSAVQHLSAQQIVTAALDAYIARHPDLEALVDQARQPFQTGD